MKATIKHLQQEYHIDLHNPIDISIPITGTKKDVNAWYVPEPTITPVREGDWVGKVSEGASTNFNNIFFNPHAHGTHTECVGHITSEFYSIQDTLDTFFFMAQVISVSPEVSGEDRIITKQQLQNVIQGSPEAIVIRTLPNNTSKLHQQYSHTNWSYLTEEAAVFIREAGIQHLLIDLPSVDKEKDGGKLLAHKAFWNYPDNTRFDATITEMVYLPDTIKDGEYLLNLQIASFDNDASPSKPILYQLLKT